MRKKRKLADSVNCVRTGNVLIVEAMASLYLSAAEETPWAGYWQDVLNTIRWGVFADVDDASQADEK